jgi:hypothetical protein
MNILIVDDAETIQAFEPIAAVRVTLEAEYRELTFKIIRLRCSYTDILVQCQFLHHSRL